MTQQTGRPHSKPRGALVAQLVELPVSNPGGCGFESHRGFSVRKRFPDRVSKSSQDQGSSHMTTLLNPHPVPT